MADIRAKKGSKGNSYQVRYPDKSKKSGSSYKTFTTMKAARAFLQSPDTWVKKTDSPIKTVDEAVEYWLEICEKEGTDGQEPVTLYTLKNYRYRGVMMKSYGWSKPLQELTPPDIVRFRSWLLGSYTKDQAKKALSSFHTVLKEMALRGIVTNNVASGVSIKSSSRYDVPVEIPTAHEIERLLNAADRLAQSDNKQTARTWKKYRPLLYLAVDSGMRPQEYLVIATKNIQTDGIQIDRALERGGFKLSVPKTKAGRRFIELSQDTLSMLNDYIKHHTIENDDDLVFPTSTGKWQQVENWRKRGFQAACIEAGLVEKVIIDGETVEKPKYTPYSLRHFYASMLIHERTDLKNIQRLMGHERIETTLNVYGHIIEKVDRAKRKKIGMLDRIGHISCGNSVADTS